MPTPTTDYTFDPGIDPTSVFGSYAAVLLQMIQNAVPNTYRGLVVWAGATPSVTGLYDWQKRCIWINTAAGPTQWHMFVWNDTTHAWQDTANFIANNAITSAMLQDGVVTLAKLAVTGGAASQLIRVKLDGTGFEFVNFSDLIATKSIDLSKITYDNGLGGTATGALVVANGNVAYSSFGNLIIEMLSGIITALSSPGMCFVGNNQLLWDGAPIYGITGVGENTNYNVTVYGLGRGNYAYGYATFMVMFATGNIGPATAKITAFMGSTDGLVWPITKNGGDPLASGDIKAGQISMLVADPANSRFHLLSYRVIPPAATTFTVPSIWDSGIITTLPVSSSIYTIPSGTTSSWTAVFDLHAYLKCTHAGGDAGAALNDEIDCRYVFENGAGFPQPCITPQVNWDGMTAVAKIRFMYGADTLVAFRRLGDNNATPQAITTGFWSYGIRALLQKTITV